jgi:PhnB protein
MATKVKTIPEGFHSVSPVLVIRDAAEALEFYTKAFGAKVAGRMDRPDGKLMHACIKVGDSAIMLGEECAPHEGHNENCPRSPADLRGTTVNLYLYVPDADKVFQQALRAGGREVMPVEEMFWGDRMGMIQDPYGHIWSIATHVRDLTPEQMKARQQEQMAHTA